MKKLLIFLILTNSLLHLLNAQELSELRIKGKGSLLPEELIDKSIRDANGEVCAGLMIVSDMGGFTYSSFNQIVSKNSFPGKDLLFLSPDERIVEIYKLGYKPLKIVLNDYGIGLKSGKVWKLEITGDRKLDIVPVNIIADAVGVKIFIDGELKGYNNTQLLTPGKHSLRLEKEGYRTVETEITVTPEQTLFSYKLHLLELQQVHIKSVPQGARIMIENADKGETDRGLFLVSGKYDLRLSKPGYLDIKETIDVNEASDNQFSFNLKKNEATLSLSIEPPDAKILINKEDYTGQKNILLSPGIYMLEAVKEGYISRSETIELKLGETLNREFGLLAKTGSFQFNVYPLDAEARLLSEGSVKYEWSGLKLLKDIPVGKYTLECSLKDHKDFKKMIIIEDGLMAAEEVRLEKLDAGSGIPWYYYVGGAVVAGGGAAAILLLRKSEPSDSKPSAIGNPPLRP